MGSRSVWEKCDVRKSIGYAIAIISPEAEEKSCWQDSEYESRVYLHSKLQAI
jgi:hypothetical protein